jgi:mannose-6-phosphate isomerase class I
VIVSKANTAEAFENSPVCKGVSFPGTGRDIDGAYITVSGRYPDAGYLTNEISKEIVYVTKGSGSLFSKDTVYEFQAGDVVFIDANDVFAWEGNFEGFFATTPAFNPAQHKEVKGE